MENCSCKYCLYIMLVVVCVLLKDEQYLYSGCSQIDLFLLFFSSVFQLNLTHGGAIHQPYAESLFVVDVPSCALKSQLLFVLCG